MHDNDPLNNMKGWLMSSQLQLICGKCYNCYYINIFWVHPRLKSKTFSIGGEWPFRNNDTEGPFFFTQVYMSTRKKGRPPIALTTNITKASNMKIHEVSWQCEDSLRWRRAVQSVSACAAPNSVYGWQQQKRQVRLHVYIENIYN